jgi:hypothetical protein
MFIYIYIYIHTYIHTYIYYRGRDFVDITTPRQINEACAAIVGLSGVSLQKLNKKLKKGSWREKLTICTYMYFQIVHVHTYTHTHIHTYTPHAGSWREKLTNFIARYPAIFALDMFENNFCVRLRHDDTGILLLMTCMYPPPHMTCSRTASACVSTTTIQASYDMHVSSSSYDMHVSSSSYDMHVSSSSYDMHVSSSSYDVHTTPLQPFPQARACMPHGKPEV